MAFLRLAVRGSDEQAVGRAFSGAVVETSLASYPGTFFTSSPSRAQAVARYWPTTVAASEVTARIECDGETIPASAPPAWDGEADRAAAGGPETPTVHVAPKAEETISVPLWVLVGGRSGDKGGDANIGLWADSEPVAEWLCARFGIAELKEALPEAAPFEVSRYPLANLGAVNFVVHGILGWGVASTLRLDTQAKGLAELLRSRNVVVPSRLLQSGKPAERSLTRV